MPHKITFLLALYLMLTGCQSTSESQLALKLTHQAIIADYINEESKNTNTNTAIIQRISSNELEQLYIKRESKTIFAKSFLHIKTLSSLYQLLGLPALDDNTSLNNIIFTYNASDNSYVAFVFNKKQEIKEIIGYKKIEASQQ